MTEGTSLDVPGPAERLERFQSLVESMLARFARSAAESAESTVTDALAGLANLVGADHAFVFRSAGDSRVDRAFEWSGPGVPRSIDGHASRGDPLPFFPWSASQVAAGLTVAVSTPADLPPEAAEERANARDEGWRAFIFVPSRGPSGEVTGALGLHVHARGHDWTSAEQQWVRVVADATGGFLDRVAAERDLRDTVGRLNDAVSDLTAAQRLAHAGSWAWDAASDITTWTEAVYEIHGRDPRSPAPTLAQQLETSRDAPRLRAAVDRALSAGEPYEYETAILRSDGTTGHIVVRGEPVRDARGRVTALRGVVIDITERRLAEQRAQRLQRLTAAMADTDRVIGGLDDADEIALAACRIAVDVGGADLAVFGVPAEPPDGIRIVASAGDRSAAGAHGLEYGIRRAFVGRLREPAGGDARAGRVSGDLAAEPFHVGHAHPGDLALRALISAPVRVSGEAIGAFAIWSQTPNAFGEDDVQIVERLAEGVGRRVELLREAERRRRAEERSERLERLNAAAAEVDRLLVRAEDETALYRAACRIAIDVAGFRMAAIWAVDLESPVGEAHLLASEGDTTGYLDRLRIARDESAPGGRGLAGRALRSGVAEVSNEVQLAPPGELRDAILATGVRSVAVFPQRQFGTVAGILAAYSPVPEAFGDAEVALIQRIVDDAAFRVEALMNQRRRAAAERALREREAELVETQRIARLGSWRWRYDGGDPWWSEETYRIFGVDPAEPIPTRDEIRAMHTPASAQAVIAAGARLRATGCPYELDVEIVLRTGEHRWLNNRVRPIVDTDGRVVGEVGTTSDITQRKVAEDALRVSEERFRTVVEHLGDGFVMTGPDGIVIDANPATAELVGWPIDEVRGAPWNRFVLPADLDRLPLQVGLIAPGGSHVFDRCLVHRDGTPIPAEMALRRLANGTVLTSIRDLRPRQEAARALRESEARFRLLFQQSTLPMAIERHGALIDANDAFRVMVGQVGIDLATLRVADLIAPAQRPEIAALARQEMDFRPFVGFETVAVRSDGTELPIEVDGYVIDLPDGPALVLMVTDLTERRAAEAARDRLFAAVEQAEESVVITDAAGTIVYVNPHFEAVSGYSRAEAVGANPRILKSGLQDDSFYAGMWRNLAAGRPWAGELVNRRKNGTLFREYATLSPVVDVAGRIVNFVAVKRDITHERELEGQLAQAQKMEAIGRLAGGIAHDFNNLLTAISGFAELAVLDAEPGTAVERDLREVMGAARRASVLTRQLLAFSRRQVLEPRVIDINRIVSDIAPMLRRVIGEDVRLVLRTAPDLARTMADPGQVEQVVMNLAVNARDAMPDGGDLVIETADVRIDAGCAESDGDHPSGQYVELSVSDTGMGIPTAALPHIFEPFFTTKEAGKGTGLGLSTVFGIVRQSGGHLTVQSTAGHGSTFRVRLPAYVAPVDDTCADATPSSPSGGPETILVVEDEAPVRAFAARLLADRGYRVVTAENGEQALLIVERLTAVDLVFTDLVMPGMTGRTVAERIVSMRPTTRVLFSSGYSDDLQLTGVGISSQTAFIAKPYSASGLLQKVRAVLGTSTDPDRPTPGE